MEIFEKKLNSARPSPGTEPAKVRGVLLAIIKCIFGGHIANVSGGHPNYTGCCQWRGRAIRTYLFHNHESGYRVTR